MWLIASLPSSKHVHFLNKLLRYAHVHVVYIHPYFNFIRSKDKMSCYNKDVLML